jgi:Subtilase family
VDVAATVVGEDADARGRPRKRTTGSPGLTAPADDVAVAVIDSGIATDDIDGAFRTGINLSGEGSPEDTRDDCGHGTKVASTLRRLAPRSPLVPIKVTDRRGVLPHRDNLTAAFAWIAEHRQANGIAVICAAVGDQSNLTGDDGFRGSALQLQIAALRAAGVLTVAPAGNWRRLHGAGRQGMVWPAILREIVSVGAVRRTPDGLRLTDGGQRLQAGLHHACATTVFTIDGPPGETSGATAAIAGCLARLAGAGGTPAARGALSALLRLRREARDDDGATWPAVLAEDVLGQG